jgi:hypothetical protein
MAEGLADDEGAPKADDGGGTGLWARLVDAVSGAAAARWPPPPRVTVSAMPIPVRARTPAKTARPDRKLISSMRALITRLSLAAQPVPSLTTKHDTWVSGAAHGYQGPPHRSSWIGRTSIVPSQAVGCLFHRLPPGVHHYHDERSRADGHRWLESFTGPCRASSGCRGARCRPRVRRSGPGGPRGAGRRR